MSNVWGKIQSNCKLSGQLAFLVLISLCRRLILFAGTPDLLLALSNSQTLHDCSFHPCVRYDRLHELVEELHVDEC